jgi:glutathione S-transferase
MLALYHYDRSTAVQRVRLQLAEKGLAWESRYVDPSFAKRQQHDPDYLKLNPRGVVPTLIHDGRAIRESIVIMEYIEDVFPEPALRPAHPFARAQMRLWTKQVDEHLHVDSRTIGQCVAMRYIALEADSEVIKTHYAVMPDEVRRDNDAINNKLGLDSPLLPGAIRRFKRLFANIDRTVRDQPFLAGETLSLADLALVVYVGRLRTFQLGPLLEEFTYMMNWFGRIRSRTSWAEAVEKWGDHTGATRATRGAEAAPRVKAMWDAAG